MNIALFSLQDIDLTSIMIDLNPVLILTSNRETNALRLADAALQLDEKIHFENINIDLVCVINHPNLNLQQIKNNFVNDYTDRFYFATKNLYTSSFYCKPHIFSLLSNLYKNDLNIEKYQDFQEHSTESLIIKLLHLIFRLGIDIKID